MNAKQALLLSTSLLGATLFCAHRSSAEAAVPSDAADRRLIRIAELEIDPSQVEPYKAALEEEIETSIRVEPGVLTLFAVSIKGHPEQIRLFETYRDVASYQAHLQTEHFKRYKALTQRMVKSLTLLETDPVLLGSKSP